MYFERKQTNKYKNNVNDKEHGFERNISLDKLFIGNVINGRFNVTYIFFLFNASYIH